MNGEIINKPINEIKIKLSENQNLTSVKMRWKWKWTESDWDESTQTVTYKFSKPLEKRIYTVQLHGWDAESNHYSAAWLFQKK